MYLIPIILLKKQRFTTVVWYHGGGLTAGDKELPKSLLNQGICVVGVRYRLCPTNELLNQNVTTEDVVDDAAAAAAWVMKNIERYGGDSTKNIFQDILREDI